MEFTLRTPEGFIGRIYTYGYYDRCFFRGNGGTVNVLRISGPQGYPECGTQRVRNRLSLYTPKMSERRPIGLSNFFQSFHERDRRRFFSIVNPCIRKFSKSTPRDLIRATNPTRVDTSNENKSKNGLFFPREILFSRKFGLKIHETRSRSNNDRCKLFLSKLTIEAFNSFKE